MTVDTSTSNNINLNMYISTYHLIGHLDLLWTKCWKGKNCMFIKYVYLEVNETLDIINYKETDSSSE